MTDILENSLVRKYFGCDGAHPDCATIDMAKHTTFRCEDLRAFRILTAMQEPIRKGERYLQCLSDGRIIEDIWKGDMEKFGWKFSDDEFHGHHLRLPDRFQAVKKECEGCVHDNCQCQCECHGGLNTQSPPAPEKCCECPDCGKILWRHVLHHCKPADSAKKPYCGKCHVELTDRISAQMHMNCHKEADSEKAVEAKIDEIELKVWKFGKANIGEAVGLGRDLRELIELARK